jgi:two-component system, OmpR family, sensor kinase
MKGRTLMLGSLFWKIFAAFMTANVLAMVSAVYYLMPTDESKEFFEVRQEFGLNMAATIIARIESGQSVDLFRSDLTSPMRGRRSFFKKILIIDSQDNIIFGEQNIQKNQQHSFVDYQSDSGRQYRVGTDISKKPSIFEYLFRPRQTVRFVVLFFFTIVASFILSLLIIRPLKKLRKHAQNLSDGNMQSRVEKNLLKRNDEIGDLSRELDEMADTLNNLINSKQQLLHDVSHELRAPLGRLQAISAIMQQQPDDSNKKKVKRIERECVRMNELIQEILEYSRTHYDRESMRTPSSVNLSALFRKLVKNVQQEYPSHPIQLNHIDDQLNITGHANRLNRAFENILRNACKHTPEKTSIDISAQQVNRHIEIQIRDHGPGVDKEDLAGLTTPFFRADGAKHTVGYGLGLSISKRIIRHHRGIMNISNHHQGGLLISVIFPVVSLKVSSR